MLETSVQTLIWFVVVSNKIYALLRLNQCVQNGEQRCAIPLPSSFVVAEQTNSHSEKINCWGGDFVCKALKLIRVNFDSACKVYHSLQNFGGRGRWAAEKQACPR